MLYLAFTQIYLLLSQQWQATPVLLPRKSHGWRSLVGYSPWGRHESAVTERLHFHFSLSRNGEGNGSPLQCSCLENPRDGRAWWAAVYGVAQSRTRLKRLSSSSSRATPQDSLMNIWEMWFCGLSAWKLWPGTSLTDSETIQVGYMWEGEFKIVCPGIN